MRAISALAIIGISLPVFAQTGRIQNGTAYTKDGVGFAYEMRLEPSVPAITSQNLGGGVLADEGMHRFISDNSRHVYFGYDISVERLPDATAYRVTIRPLSVGVDKFHRPVDLTNFTMLPLPGYPAPQTLHSGDVMALDLMTNPETGQKIVDYISILEPRRGQGTFNPDPPRQLSYTPGTPRDFTVEDASLRLAAPRLTVNGKLDESSTRHNGEVAGGAVWIYVPNRGRFILSLVPHRNLGFQKAGEVRGSTLTFTVGSETYTVSCANSIAPGDTPFNVYVLQDRAWKPSYAFADLSAVTVGAADRPESLVGRQ